MIVAAEFGNYLIQTPDGSRYIKAMIRDGIDAARAREDLAHELALKLVLHHYLCCQPECAEIAKSPPTHAEQAIQRVLERATPRLD